MHWLIIISNCLMFASDRLVRRSLFLLYFSNWSPADWLTGVGEGPVKLPMFGSGTDGLVGWTRFSCSGKEGEGDWLVWVREGITAPTCMRWGWIDLPIFPRGGLTGVGEVTAPTCVCWRGVGLTGVGEGSLYLPVCAGGGLTGAGEVPRFMRSSPDAMAGGAIWLGEGELSRVLLYSCAILGESLGCK